ncbi:class IIb bacteriocin, lactobin A/cerein 7B family [Listeria booriae]|uniref:Class IIb bacteriocin, lactobin A/cerein 7B family n=1 Tax=Listeria booriae TaxID=1552123 RepID=A0A842AUB8_9LIST|nr:class IIb bacteriocin, lactobin A/cerein 7B family [Listeria booriae]MBC1795440.1 class IIb bacteriocin, lactobin A/cerein 7B family [Listeria booriae]MBC2187742.1 class IIb bacteriocin, lactobin A/cerein 7B family [Listeria booriae]
MSLEQKFSVVSSEDLCEVNGGLIITGTLVAAGIGLFCATFGVGYAIGQAIKK